MARNAKVILIVAVVCIAAILVYVLRRSATQTPPGAAQPAIETATAPQRPATSESTNSAPVSAAPITAPSAIAAAAPARNLPPPPPPATPFQFGSADNPPNMEPATVVENMRVAISLYRSMFGNNPVGTNPEITRALNGENPKQARLIKEEAGLRINAKGELVDYWGTPFFFHQLSGTEMEIHSAGPDRQMWTGDDIVIK
jgi:hypothetical protein